MRRSWIALAVMLGAGGFATSARAHDAGFSDPFFLYYGFFLPRQAALAAQPQPEDNIRALASQRQFAAQSERAGLYDPIGGLGLDELNPLNPFGQRSGSSRGVPRHPANGISNSNLRGRGVGQYHNRTMSYYPGLRAGVGGGGARRSFTGGGSAGRSGASGSPFMPRPTSGMPGR